MSGPRSQCVDLRLAREQLDEGLEAMCRVEPRVYAERKALVASMDARASKWREEPVRLPRGVELVVAADLEGRPVHTVQWPPGSSVAPPVAFHDRALAVAAVWTVFVLRRPWAVDDERLRALVEHPPVPRARILGDLLSIRFVAAILEGVETMQRKCSENIPSNPDVEGIREVFRSFESLRQMFWARGVISIHEVAGLLEVAEPDTCFGDEVRRWRWMLHDYSRALDPRLHEQIEALFGRFAASWPKGVGEVWEQVCDLRQLDACTGLLLARAAMVDGRHRPSTVTLYVDAMASRAAGSLAWWCHWVLDALEEERALGDRMRAEQIPELVELAVRGIEQLDADYYGRLVEAFPSVRS